MPITETTDDIAEISGWWAAGGATRDRFYRFYRFFQIAGSPHDQLVPDGVEYFPVRRADHAAAGLHPGSALLLCWPSYSKPWAEQALAAYRGDLLIYIGEGEGGCCADDGLFDRLDREWSEVESSPHHLTWWGIHDQMIVYRRR
jgi:hypothetical protein